MVNIALKEVYEVAAKHEAFYTGGNVQWSTDGQYLFCQNHGTVSVLSVEKGIVICNLGMNYNDIDNDDPVNSFIVTSDYTNIITHHKSGLFKLWNWKDNKLITLWKSLHNGPVTCMTTNTNINTNNSNKMNLLLVSGGNNGSVRLWDLEHRICTQSLKGAQGIISVLAFHSCSKKEFIFAADNDFKIHGWDMSSGKREIILSGHFSEVTSLSFHEKEDYLISSGRDRVLILWNIISETSIRVLPVYEEIEDTFIIPTNTLLHIPVHNKNEDSIYVVAAGEKGIVKIWDMITSQEIYPSKNSDKLETEPKEHKENSSITHLIYNSTNNNFIVVTADHNIIIHSLETFKSIKQFVGYSDEILDIVYFGEEESHMAVATNSCDIKLYDSKIMACQLLRGHTDIVLALATTPVNVYLLLSSSKDNSIRLWFMDKVTAKVSCIASAVRHNASVGSIAISRMSSKFCVSVSQDSCLKLWNLPEDITVNDKCSLSVVHTTMAHEKDINSVTISPNDKLIATGSQDKTAKLWSTSDLQLLGVFRGHRRGVWCVRFSPIDQVLLTTSADCTMKIWSLAELNCLKTIEGHESSILKAEFLSRGMQLITASGDGLLKLWNIKTSECVCTLEQHSNRIWTLAVSKDEKSIISGGSDSALIFWRDVTEERKRKAAMEMEQLALEEQELSNLLKSNDLLSALNLALKLKRPLQVLKITENILNKGTVHLKHCLDELKPTYKEELLRCAIAWNTNSKNCHVAQVIINALMMKMEEEISTTESNTVIESLIPYTQRHYTRITKLLRNLHLLNYTLNRMTPNVPLMGSK
ncbi:transducin beta-like protein 3 [Calliopsis andreniformis]|uniref:transducin beta-like protein 3 n=1 Tax=Calliopsis andreniformis TaxID=337506 RepID=UPI003FCD1A3C